MRFVAAAIALLVAAGVVYGLSGAASFSMDGDGSRRDVPASLWLHFGVVGLAAGAMIGGICAAALRRQRF